MTKPDILVKRKGRVELIIDTEWKRVSRLVDDPNRGVSQADVYQMMAYYRQLYACADLLLLYPHRHELDALAGTLSTHSIVGTSSQLRTATLDLSNASLPVWRQIVGCDGF